MKNVLKAIRNAVSSFNREKEKIMEKLQQQQAEQRRSREDSIVSQSESEDNLAAPSTSAIQQQQQQVITTTATQQRSVQNNPSSTTNIGGSSTHNSMSEAVTPANTAVSVAPTTGATANYSNSIASNTGGSTAPATTAGYVEVKTLTKEDLAKQIGNGGGQQVTSTVTSSAFTESSPNNAKPQVDNNGLKERTKVCNILSAGLGNCIFFSGKIFKNLETNKIYSQTEKHSAKICCFVFL